MNQIPIYHLNGSANRWGIPAAGMSQSALELTASGIADKIVNAMLPRLTPIVQSAAEAAEPTIRTVVREEVMPKVGLYSVIGLAAVAAVAAFVGIAMSRRGR